MKDKERKYGRIPADELIQKLHLANLSARNRLVCEYSAKKDYETVNILLGNGESV